MGDILPISLHHAVAVAPTIKVMQCVVTVLPSYSFVDFDLLQGADPVI